MAETLSEFFDKYGNLLLNGIGETLVMTAVATLVACLIGVPIGIALIMTAPNGLRPSCW